jgi:hypothetical protein
MDFGEQTPGRSPRSADAGARRLFAAVRGACGEVEGLPARLAVGLGGALEILADDPKLAYQLTVDPYLGDDRSLEARNRWIVRFGDLLRDAAAEDPRASREPAFLAPFLIGGVRFQIARLVLRGDVADLPHLLPGTLEALLAYYFEPGEPRALADAALTRR